MRTHVFSFIFFLGAFIVVSNGQETPLIYKLQGFVETDKVMLRWAPANEKSWREGIKTGYKLSRFTIAYDGVEYTKEQSIESKVILLDSIKPLPEDDWELKADSNRYAGIAAGAIYGDTFEIEDLSSSETMRAFSQIKQNENRFAFSLMAAEMDFTVASDMGLAYIDTDHIQPGFEYLYILTLGQDKDTLVLEDGLFIAKIDSISTLDKVDSLVVTPGDKAAFIQWSLPIESEYSAYQVERSSDGGQTFLKINDLPQVTVEGENQQGISITDTLADNNTVYVYRVRGINSFGMLGPPSDTIQVQGKVGKKDYQIVITNIDEVVNQGMLIHWQYQNIPPTNEIAFVDVYKARGVDQDYVKINPSPIPNTQNNFMDPNPYLSNYYRVVMTDIHGHQYISIHSLSQKADSTPPAVPTQLVGTIDNNGQVFLKWGRNIEEDMNGYRVFLSNFRDSVFVQVSEDIIRDTFYSYTVSLNTLTKKVYFKITAEDQRHNRSEKSLVCEITRPDIIPPSNPLLHVVNPTPAGIYISFIPSMSEDVTFHKLQRRKLGTRLWSTLYSIPGVQYGQSYAYIDSTVTIDYIYQYRILAIDGDDNFSSSKIIDVRAFDTGLRGDILALEVNKVTYTNNTASGNSSNYVSAYPSTVNIVQWDYLKKDDLFSFEIYRSIENGPFRIIDVVYMNKNTHTYPPELMQFVNLNKFFYIDMAMLQKNVIGQNGSGNGGGNGAGGNGSGGNGPGGNGSGGNNPNGNGNSTNRIYNYKVIAHHLDGATSTFSQSTSVTVN